MTQRRLAAAIMAAWGICATCGGIQRIVDGGPVTGGAAASLGALVVFMALWEAIHGR